MRLRNLSDRVPRRRRVSFASSPCLFKDLKASSIVTSSIVCCSMGTYRVNEMIYTKLLHPPGPLLPPTASAGRYTVMSVIGIGSRGGPRLLLALAIYHRPRAVAKCTTGPLPLYMHARPTRTHSYFILFVDVIYIYRHERIL
jgi:hypothetical protein